MKPPSLKLAKLSFDQPSKQASSRSRISRLHKRCKLAVGFHAGRTAEAAAVLTRLSPLRQHFPSLLLLPVFTETFASKPSAPRSLPSPPSPALIPTLSIQRKVRRRRGRGGPGLLSLAQILTRCRCRGDSRRDLHTRGRIYSAPSARAPKSVSSQTERVTRVTRVTWVSAAGEFCSQSRVN